MLEACRTSSNPCGKNGKEMERKIRSRIGKGKRDMGEDGR